MEEGRKCDKCGYVNPVDAMFCGGCGARLHQPGNVIDKKILNLTLIAGLIAILDSLMNRMVLTVALSLSILLILNIIVVASGIVIIGVWLSRRRGGVYSGEGVFKVLIASIIIILIGNLTLYILTLIIGNPVIAPLWLFYIYLLRELRSYGVGG